MGIRIKKDFPSFDVFIVIFDDEKTMALMDPNQKVDAPVPFKRHEIDWIVFLTCTYRPNPKIREEIVEKNAEEVGQS
ncbi:hypothetical protein CRE_16303 [Caenorhabditis remanei]|uniref:Uncharacterized protein n=1 Tax=Caenorhabditis remanei TaxID=31234 RepID=E3N7Z8_CAERE|nr:hypothetical protein CRE_16303 [Caenorhabditis remanei]